jgi:hypothetical protein
MILHFVKNLFTEDLVRKVCFGRRASSLAMTPLAAYGGKGKPAKPAFPFPFYIGHMIVIARRHDEATSCYKVECFQRMNMRSVCS